MTEKIAAALDEAAVFVKGQEDWYVGLSQSLPAAREELAALEEEVLRLRLENKKWEAHVATLSAPRDLLRRAEEAERALRLAAEWIEGDDPSTVFTTESAEEIESVFRVRARA